ncbi:MAG: hypothetical protein NTU80_07555, partial [Verrucomicrobia bacterium]|nr:hypothetical protein [Verrucomicrobiota bacterium]
RSLPIFRRRAASLSWIYAFGRINLPLEPIAHRLAGALPNTTESGDIGRGASHQQTGKSKYNPAQCEQPVGNAGQHGHRKHRLPRKKQPLPTENTYLGNL